MKALTITLTVLALLIGLTATARSGGSDQAPPWVDSIQAPVRLTARVSALAVAVVNTWPEYVDLQAAHDNARNAVLVERLDLGIDAETLLSIAYLESRFDATGVSRYEPAVGHRVSSPWTHDRQAGVGPWHCGVGHATARTWAACKVMRDSYAAAYRELVASLVRWHGWTNGSIRRTLAGFGCGADASRTGICNGYPGRVLRWRRALITVAGVPRS
jgi:hypothetical protein